MKKIVFFFVFGSLFLATTLSKAADAIVIRNLNFRTGPSTQYALRGLIPAGEFVFVKNCEGNWCHIRYNAQIGWVSSRYLSFKDGDDLYRTYTLLSIKHNNICHDFP
ncbi:SH3 domain-containing protein [Bartonella raoultii]|uniref:SH3 domain-containing protein n=1 Tax=Bartonella raoultii TaxID=1457020 RepID=A0ABS7I7D8_9HYPH|nr:SH3 domain-containing protein [Bartonella raoultii]MBX4335091.1 SH3 domain-containing protein [Bartonella raoultii]